jgi:ectoine hydroxylase-related dioxygenase (phytanoyl-CoA dioxygenase family)
LHERLRAEAPGAPVALCVEPGDAVLVHGALAHTVSVNRSVQVRVAVYFRLYHRDDDHTSPEPLLDPGRFFERVAPRR